MHIIEFQSDYGTAMNVRLDFIVRGEMKSLTLTHRFEGEPAPTEDDYKKAATGLKARLLDHLSNGPMAGFHLELVETKNGDVWA